MNEDLEVGVRGLYRDSGYFKVSVGEPILENIDTVSGRMGIPVPIMGHSHGKAVNITIPIEEGDRYHMGTLKIVSSDPEKDAVPQDRCPEDYFPAQARRHFLDGKSP